MNKTLSNFSSSNVENSRAQNLGLYNDIRRNMKVNTNLQSKDISTVKHNMPDLMRSTTTSSSPVTQKNKSAYQQSSLFKNKLTDISTKKLYIANENFKEADLSLALKSLDSDIQSPMAPERHHQKNRSSILKSRVKTIEDDSSIEEVKRIDDWQLNRKKNDLFKFGMKSQSTAKLSSLTTIDRMNLDFPKINTHFIDNILKSSKEEDLKIGNTKEGANASRYKESVNIRHGREKTSDQRTFHKSLDVKIQENKEEIINSIVMKKIRKQLYLKTEQNASPEVVKHHIDSIAKTTISPFKSLKGMHSKNRANDYYRQLSGSQLPEQQNSFRLSMMEQTIEIKSPKSSTDYHKIERELLKELERTFETIEKLIKRRGTTLIQVDQLSREIKSYEDRLSDLTGKQRDLEKRYMKSLSISLKKSRTIRPDDGTLDSPIKEDTTVEFKKANNDAKAKIVKLEEKIIETKRKRTLADDEIQRLNKEIKVQKESKASYKIHLRELYLDLLQNEDRLLKASSSSYAWVIRALWNIKQKVDDSLFPKYLDLESIAYIIEYAKIQKTLVQFCKERHLLHLISNYDDFRHEALKNYSATMSNRSIAGSPDIASTSISPETCPKGKSFSSMLNMVRDRIKHVKGQNLVTKDDTSSSTRNITWRNNYKLSQTIYTPSSEWSHGISTNRGSDVFTGVEKPSLDSFVESPDNESEDKQTINQLLRELEIKKDQEKEKIFEKYLSVKLSTEQKQLLLKTFIFLFGSSDGNGYHSTFLKEQKCNGSSSGLTPKMAQFNVLNKISNRDKTSIHILSKFDDYDSGMNRTSMLFRKEKLTPINH